LMEMWWLPETQRKRIVMKVKKKLLPENDGGGKSVITMNQNFGGSSVGFQMGGKEASKNKGWVWTLLKTIVETKGGGGDLK